MAAEMRQSRSAGISLDLTFRMERYEAERRDVRLSIRAALLGVGLPTAEFGDLLGVSSQLAKSFMRDECKRAYESPTDYLDRRSTPDPIFQCRTGK